MLRWLVRLVGLGLLLALGCLFAPAVALALSIVLQLSGAGPLVSAETLLSGALGLYTVGIMASPWLFLVSTVLLVYVLLRKPPLSRGTYVILILPWTLALLAGALLLV